MRAEVAGALARGLADRTLAGRAVPSAAAAPQLIARSEHESPPVTLPAPVVYDIPIKLAAAYRGQKVIVRVQRSCDLLNAFSSRDLDNIAAVKLLSLIGDVDTIAGWGYGVPVELMVAQPQNQFPLLYRHVKLLDKHPLRVSIPIVPGFSRAVKLAASLNFVVKLEPGQPAPEVIEEMSAMVDFYLHQRSVSQPIEFFHSTILDFYHGGARTLWEIQEEDPALVRYVTDDGVEQVNRYARSPGTAGELNSFVPRLQAHLAASGAECVECKFAANCGGYFKWPRQDYSCAGIKRIFRRLRAGADELKSDLSNVADSSPEAIV